MRLRSRLDALVDHPWLIGDADVPGRVVARRTRWMTIVAIAQANAVGAVVVTTFALLVLPKPTLDDSTAPIAVNLGLAGLYTLLALVVGILWGTRRLEGGRNGIGRWLRADREPTPEQARLALRAPLRIMTVEAVLWGLAVVVFTLANVWFDPLLALGVAATVALGGITTSAAAYLLCELSFRPIVSRALATGVPQQRRAGGVGTRWLLAWALGTGVPVLGLAMVGVVSLTSVDISESALGVTIVVLCGIALLAGAVVTSLAVYATVHPIASIRSGLDRVRSGDLDASVRVWDTTQVGSLQAGFNEMVRGLRDRERLRDMFGRQVGEDVAKRALEDELRLGGEVREVSVLFVDVVGSTELASERSPEDVVSLLNRFFAVVVEEVESAGGWINKFEGDAALAIFGAPVAMDDAAGAALCAARRLAERLPEDVPDLRAGIGVATGEAVAGNVGTEQRFEYTVIGDPVNEAARLSDLSKQHDPPVLASSTTVDRADGDECGRWKLGDEVELRGRSEPTRLACPA